MTAEKAHKATWTPTLASLPVDSPDSTLPLAEELEISALDLTGGYHSRAARTQRFNEKKWEEKEYGKQRRTDEMRQRKAGPEADWIDVLV